ncbi:MAG: zinc ribbon domain-containing protein [Candidatus Binatales bacterium]
MALHKSRASFPTCPRCGAVAHLPGARFCGQCGASLTDASTDLPEWQRPAPAKYEHVVMSRLALSCPECGYAMRFGFRRVCRRCGAKLVMVPRLLHPNHYRVYVCGPRAALAGLTVELFWFAAVIGALALIGGALK